MHVIFVNYHSLACNSGGHLLNLALALGSHGISSTIFVPFSPGAVPLAPSACDISCHAFEHLDSWLADHSPSPRKTLVVAWTPRENVRNFVTSLRDRFSCPYVVHLEDNETLITATHLGLEPEALLRLPQEQLGPLIPPDARLSHPVHSVKFLAQSQGVTALMDTLLSSLAPQHPRHTFWPGAEEAFFNTGSVDYDRRRSLGIPDGEHVIAYTGNVHPINQAEVRSLYLATCILNRRGTPTRLIRTGEDHVPVFTSDIPEINRHLLHLGRLPSAKDIAATLALADFLVQPGRCDSFNDYRFPSKLPEFFATGRPVLLPAANLGRFVRDGEDALVLNRGDALEIADRITRLVADPSHAQRLGSAARAFALTHFRWPAIAGQLLAFYKTVLLQNAS